MPAEEVEKGAPGGGKQQPTPAEVGAQRRLLKERAEVMVRLKKGRGFSAGGGGTVDKARTAVDALLRDLVRAGGRASSGLCRGTARGGDD